jgi:hypothetical protein
MYKNNKFVLYNDFNRLLGDDDIEVHEGIELQPLTRDLAQEKKEMPCKIEIGGELVEFKSTKELFHNE